MSFPFARLSKACRGKWFIELCQPKWRRQKTAPALESVVVAIDAYLDVGVGVWVHDAYTRPARRTFLYLGALVDERNRKTLH